MQVHQLLLVVTICWMLACASGLTETQLVRVKQICTNMFDGQYNPNIDAHGYDNGFFVPANVVRAGFHDAGTYSRRNGKGGAHAILFRECKSWTDKCERSLQDNSGLDAARVNIMKAYEEEELRKVLSVADFLQVCVLMAIERTSEVDDNDEPVLKFEHFNFQWGRKDYDASQSVQNVLPPSMTTLQGNRNFMGINRLGLQDEGILALLGAHTIGSAHPGASGHYGPWDWTPEVWDNGYYANMASPNWWWNPTYKQYERRMAECVGCKVHKSIMLQADFVFWQDHLGNPASTHLRNLVVDWAEDARAWDKAFIKAWDQVAVLGNTVRPVCKTSKGCEYVPGK